MNDQANLTTRVVNLLVQCNNKIADYLAEDVSSCEEINGIKIQFISHNITYVVENYNSYGIYVYPQGSKSYVCTDEFINLNVAERFIGNKFGYASCVFCTSSIINPNKRESCVSCNRGSCGYIVCTNIIDGICKDCKDKILT